LILEVTSVIGEGTPESEPFGVGDNWIWGGEFGRCNPRVANGKDAAIRIKEELNKRFPNPNNLSGGRGYFVDEEVHPFFANDASSNRNPNDNPIRDNNRDFLLYWADSAFPNYDSHKCLNPDDMNWYYGNTYSFISNRLSLIRKSFIAIPLMKGDVHAHLNRDLQVESWQFHRGTIQMGTYIKLPCRDICSPIVGFCHIDCLGPLADGPM
jgi:hypothetical protein